MRVTNTMITNSSMMHVGNAKKKVMTANDQYASGKKIQRPSDDPIIAVRALKYRSDMAEINQYVEKNIPDAQSWVSMTDSTLDNISTILGNMVYYCNQGANDTLTAQDRDDVLATLKQYVEDIYTQEANADYNGRYIFTGYRTDSSMVFGKTEKNLQYNIKENFNAFDIESFNVVQGGTAYNAAYTTGQQYVDESASIEQVYRLVLAYDDLSNSEMTVDAQGNVTQPSGTVENYVSLDYSYKDATGAVQKASYNAVTKASTDTGAYSIGDDEVVFLYDTGELLVGKNVQANLVSKDASISVEYTKTRFDDTDIRPEHYFESTCYDIIADKVLEYGDPDGQDIKYDISFSQNIKVNTQGKDAISTSIQRTYDYIYQTVDAVKEVEDRIADADKVIKATTDKADLAKLESLKKTLEAEHNLRTRVMQEAFGKGLTMIKDSQQMISNATSDLGARENRLELTYNKMLDMQDKYEEMLSDNEDIGVAEAIVNLSQADDLYNASLGATAKILGNTLLDYI